MKKLDVLMLKSFVGPLVLTTAVANFILLIQYMLKYFDDFVGKNLGFSVFAELLFYFSLNMLQIALPLGVLLASLMTFGNLGENFELTAIKSSGISLLRTLRPIFLFVFVLSIGAFFFNNYTIPAANLKAYSLLYDIKHTKPALDIKAGAFYNGIPNYSIKAKDKLPDGKTLIDVVIYDHSLGRGNKTVILADSALMFTIMDDRYLKLELHRGHYYFEEAKSGSKIDRFHRTEYDNMDMVFSLASFDMKRRKEELFQNNRQMKNISELAMDVDSFENKLIEQRRGIINTSRRYFGYHFNNKEFLEQSSEPKDTIANEQKMLQEASLLPFGSMLDEAIAFLKSDTLPVSDSTKAIPAVSRALAKKDSTKRTARKVFTNTSGAQFAQKVQLPTSSKIKYGNRFNVGGMDTLTAEHLQAFLDENKPNQKVIYSEALNKARNMKVSLSTAKTRLYQTKKDLNLYTVEMQKKYALALACIIMFLVGAPLGAIIKKGGLGVPTILAVFFFIIYYLFTSIGEKQAKEGAMNPYVAAWMADFVLMPFGFFFLRQARIDARLFEVDAYLVWIEKLKRRFARNDNKA